MPLKELGLAEFVGLKPGEYTVHLTVPGFAAVKKDINVVEGDNEFTFQVVEGALIRGKVTGSDGKVLTAITVRLRKEDEDKWGGWGTGKSARTNEDGSFQVGPVEPGDWLLEVYNNNGWAQVYTTTLTVTTGDTEHNITVETGAAVEVSIIDEQGNKVSWGNVRVQGEKNYSGNSNAEGVATVTFITPGEYLVSATANGKASIASRMYLNNGSIKLTLTVKAPNTCRVTEVYKDSQAAKAGVKVGDLLIEYGSVKIKNWRHVAQAKRTVKEGVETQVTVDRDGQILSFPIKGGTIGIDGEDAVR
jgi:hypothetical protein